MMFCILSFLSPNTKGVVCSLSCGRLAPLLVILYLSLLAGGELSQFLLPLDGSGEELRVSQLSPVG